MTNDPNPKASSNIGMVIGVILIVLIIVVAYVFYTSHKGPVTGEMQIADPAETSQTTNGTPATDTAAETPANQ